MGRRFKLRLLQEKLRLKLEGLRQRTSVAAFVDIFHATYLEIPDYYSLSVYHYQLVHLYSVFEEATLQHLGFVQSDESKQVVETTLNE